MECLERKRSEMNKKLTKGDPSTIIRYKKYIPYHLFFLSVLDEVRNVVELTSI